MQGGEEGRGWNLSNFHEQLPKKKGTFTAVAEEVETSPTENNQNMSQNKVQRKRTSKI